MGGIDPIVISAGGGLQSNVVTLTDASQGAKERVAMPGNRYIARSARQRSTGNVSGRFAQYLVAVAFEDDGGKSETRDLHATDEGPFNRRRWHRDWGWALGGDGDGHRGRRSTRHFDPDLGQVAFDKRFQLGRAVLQHLIEPPAFISLENPRLGVEPSPGSHKQ